ncbi:MAG: hypothetical protein Q4B84_04820 [Clostridia bacterium]|nr:hypothetical protein [Clostridia bacterium]
MEHILNWSSVLCVLSFVCVISEFFILPGNLEKFMRSILYIFFTCVLITFFSFKNMNFNFCNLKKNFDENKKSKINTEKLNMDICMVFKDKIENIVSSNLRSVGINLKKIDVIMNLNDNNCISINKCKVYIDKGDINKKEKILDEVQKILNLKPEIEVY